MRMRVLLACAVTMMLAAVSRGDIRSVILSNPTEHDRPHALLEIGTAPDFSPFAVMMDGSEIPFQRIKDQVWVDEPIAARSSHRFTYVPRPPARFSPRVSVSRDQFANSIILDNGIIAIQLPADNADRSTGPITAIKMAGGKWVGKSFWNTSAILKTLDSAIVSDGTSFARVWLRFTFDRGFAEFVITLEPGSNWAEISEKHSMPAGDNWEFDAARQWTPHQGLSRRFSVGFLDDADKSALGPMDRPLLPGGLPYCPSDLFIALSPRWNQHYRDGWFFAASDGRSLVGAVAVRASEWLWPIENKIDVIVRPSGDYAGLRCPTARGQRVWWLFASPSNHAPGIEEVRNYAWQNLDKLNKHYILEWPGVTHGTFTDFNWFDDATVNPTHLIRQLGKTALSSADRTGDLTTLYTVQQMFDPDSFGSYWNYESPENPNFFTDFNRVPIALTAQLRTHPQFELLRSFAEEKFKEDLYNSVTLPGGAGQECPGYLRHAIETWESEARICRQYLNFDPTQSERYIAGNSFLQRISQPDSGNRIALPIGDTHPGPNGPLPVQVDPAQVANFTTEELPGFGVVFNNRPGTPKESYIAFKAGPDRGHYHGDQLAFHFCADATPIAVFHHSSYNPRAGQEHMSNRVAFSAGRFQYANMDGYERLIAFKTSDFADIAIGQVESNRLREVEQYPPEKWDQNYPRIDLGGTLKYRRTIVFMKNGPHDYLVIRDQYMAPIELKATFCLHVLASAIQIEGTRVEWPNLTLYCVRPAVFASRVFPWSHQNGGKESTLGIMLTQTAKAGEFITVVYPGRGATVIPNNNGVNVDGDEISFAGGWSDSAQTGCLTGAPAVEVHRGAKTFVVAASDIDLNRSQGQIGLFVPDAGYPLGPIPDWLVAQRSQPPLWAKLWWK